MSFLPLDLTHKVSGGRIPGEGPRDAKIAIIGEAGGAEEDRLKKPFVGPAGRVLEQCMHAAGMIRAETYISNVIKIRPVKNDISPYYNQKTGKFTDAGWEWVEELHKEMDDLKPNIIVAAGNVPMAALTRRKKGITKYRGYIEEAQWLKHTKKILPTLHPSATFFRGEKEGGTKGGPGKGASPYIGRYYISHDLRKAKKYSLTLELERPKREAKYNFGSSKDVVAWIKEIASAGRVSTDIEVLNFEMSCISLSCNPSLGICIPFSDQRMWSLYEEGEIIRALQKYVFGARDVVKVVQNGIFDLWFLFLRYGIVTRGPVEDTMIGHHIMYFDMGKSLEFLGSIYCGAQEYWKDMVSFDNIKENA
jgi:DNA polymerase